MKQVLIGLCFLGAACFAMPQEEGRGLSLFNVVKFQNDLCTGSKMNGTCYTKAECESKGGNDEGECAQGFGVCCVISLDCGGMSNDNNTYLQKTSTTDLVGSSCTYEICPANSKICRIRYDFTSHTIASPASATAVIVANDLENPAAGGNSQAGSVGNCNVDSFTIANNGGVSPPLICGYNDGQHMILDTDGAGCQDVTFQIGSSAGVTRKWDIIVTQHTCDEMDTTMAGPMGCLQYFTGTTGTIQSFNFPSGGMAANGVGASATHLNNQDYKICIRQEKSITKICYAAFQGADADATNQGSFGLSVSPSATIAQSNIDSNCNTDYIAFNGGLYASTATAVAADGAVRSCGRIFATAAAALLANADVTFCAFTTPFEVKVHFDDNEVIQKGAMMKAEVNEPVGVPSGTIGFGLGFVQS